MRLSTGEKAWDVAKDGRLLDRLAEALAHGITQYLILGAGLDTFAYRARGPASMLRVFEVDTPELQAWKRERLETCRISRALW